MTESHPLPSGRDCVASAVEWKGFVEELKRQWRLLWRERIDDKVRAEGIADRDFELLFVDRGTVVTAARCYRSLDFATILKGYEAPYDVKAKQVAPSPLVGGWRKFGREMAAGHRGAKRSWSGSLGDKSKAKSQPLRKGGRGWLHFRTK